MNKSYSHTELHNQLRKEILSRVPNYTFGVKQSFLTFGVEHEFFLTTSTGALCNHTDSQKFFIAFHNRNRNWNIVYEDNPNITMVNKVFCGINETLSEIKYEYDPHLLELSTPVFRSLEQLRGYLDKLWPEIELAARSCDLIPKHVPCITDVDMYEQSKKSISPKVLQLLSYREILLKNNGEAVELAGFPAVIAATQVQVGGINWISNNNIIEFLNQQDHFVEDISYQSFQNPNEIKEFRWKGYNAVFKGFPLIGVSKISPWAFEKWIDALLRSPLAGSEELWAAKTIIDMGKPPLDNWNLFLERVRDFQSVRPRLSGTIEFRSAPSQPDIDSIIELVSNRLESIESFYSSNA